MTASPHPTTAAPVTDAEYRAVCEFLYDEAALLDQDAYAAWLGLLTADVRYRLRARTLRALDQAASTYRVVDNNAEELRIRVGQISDPRLTFAENPPSITRRHLHNIRVRAAAEPGELHVTVNVLLHRSRGVEGEEHCYSAQRHDVLRRTDDGYLLAAREVVLDSTVIKSMNVSVLF
ncbi:aromatic-ring-hydroxylating dioxygenase subunit beta [Actinocorallia sp. A-T 12471]|uniref:aromatic-ring-hydroxylating dioxygenase subunit beta n=1 Tax=Actinocorallia sp. A-T 12471 TaxID=3089813 RepID=UPI0029CCAE82|nr:aromatic-ring-hydroxylating dioxygenase subunit beta [Actinocorallia sp. A-T 12471]MDX6740618.1 aromatic-ring-hydroxylating dioxygenase subunit beta [Actinocorallia sp. A-T 12471]